jgi:hypothetical protein
MKPRPVKMNRPLRLPIEQASSANESWTINETRIKTIARMMRISTPFDGSKHSIRSGADLAPLHANP